MKMNEHGDAFETVTYHTFNLGLTKFEYISVKILLELIRNGWDTENASMTAPKIAKRLMDHINKETREIK